MVARKRHKVKKKSAVKKRVSASTNRRVKRVSKKKTRKVSASTKSNKKKVKRTRKKAAQLGWQRRKAKKKALQRAHRAAILRQFERHPELRGADKVLRARISELEKELKSERLLRETAQRLSLPKIFADELAKERGFTQMIGRIREKLSPEDLVESDETQILLRLISAEQAGIFNEEAALIAEEYEMPVGDVFTLWFSPK